MSHIETLQRQNRDKSLKIVQLENTIRKQTTQLKQKDQKIYSLETLLKQRTQKINKINVDFFKMEQQLIEYKKMKGLYVEQSDKIEELEQIIRLQSEQIENYIRDQQVYVKFAQEMYQSNQGWFQQRGLLYEYRQQLERQVQQIQNINEELIQRNGQYENELQQQNQQGNDLLGQIQYMIECCEGVE